MASTAYFGLTANPFESMANTFVPLPSRARVLESLVEGFHEGEGITILTGDDGVGKSTLVESILQSERLPKGRVVHRLTASNTSEQDLLALTKERIQEKGDDRELRDQLIDQQKEGTTHSIVIENVEALTEENLISIRQASNFFHEGDGLLHFLLIGKPQFRQSILGDDPAKLRRRVTAIEHLMPFNVAEVAAYVEHRLQSSGAGQEGIFSQQAVLSLHQESKGLPSKIDTLAAEALIRAGMAGRKQVTADDIHSADLLTDEKAAAKVTAFPAPESEVPSGDRPSTLPNVVNDNMTPADKPAAITPTVKELNAAIEKIAAPVGAEKSTQAPPTMTQAERLAAVERAVARKNAAAAIAQKSVAEPASEPEEAAPTANKQATSEQSSDFWEPVQQLTPIEERTLEDDADGSALDISTYNEDDPRKIIVSFVEEAQTKLADLRDKVGHLRQTLTDLEDQRRNRRHALRQQMDALRERLDDAAQERD